MNINSIKFDFSDNAATPVSHSALESHYRDVYLADVKKLNDKSNWIDQTDLPSKIQAFNSLSLHEVFFDNIAAGPKAMTPPMELGLLANFHSVQKWRSDFFDAAHSLAGRPGWAVLSFNPRTGTLLNYSVNKDAHFVGTTPIIALDLHAHAYAADYSDDWRLYLTRFIDALDWEAIYRRYRHAVHAATEALSVEPGARDNTLFLDVRRAAAYQESGTLIPGAVWRDPSKVEQWGAELPRDREIVCYCVSGYEVCRATVLRLRTYGLNALYLRGGIKGWEHSGHLTAEKESGAS